MRTLHLAAAVGLLLALRPAIPAASSLLDATDDSGRTLDLRWQGSPIAEGGQAGSWIQRRIEEKFNVRLDPGFIPVFSYQRRLTFMLIGGDVPDVFWIGEPSEVRKAVEHGFALELPWAFVARHAPDYFSRLLRDAPEAWLQTWHRGRNYGLPMTNTEHTRHPFIGVWNVTWLARVGLNRTPETLVEMEEALRRFREDDPDRNGRRDTFGMCPSKPPAPPGMVDRSFEEIFGAFGIIQNGWMLRDGRVVWGGTLPEAREALAVLRRWFANGLIHPDYMVLPAGNLDLRQQLFNGKVGYFMGYNYRSYEALNPAYPSSLTSLHKNVHPDEELGPAIFPLGPRGHRGVRGWAGSLGGPLVFGAHLRAAPEKVIRVLHILNAAARDSAVYLEARIGLRGRHWEFTPERGLFTLPPYNTKARAARELIGEHVPEIARNGGYFIPFGADQALADRFTATPKIAFRERYQRPEWNICSVLNLADAVPSAGRYLGGLVQLQAAVFTAIITGGKPLESFDGFVREWHAQGGDVLTREANDLHHRKQELLVEIRRLAGPGAH